MKLHLLTGVFFLAAAAFAATQIGGGEPDPINPNPTCQSKTRPQQTHISATIQRRSRLRETTPQQKSKVEELERVANTPTADDRARLMLQFTSRLTPGELAAMADTCSQLAYELDHTDIYAILLSAWAKTDPVAASKFACQQNNVAIERVVHETWESIDPVGCKQWEDANPSINRKNTCEQFNTVPMPIFPGLSPIGCLKF